MRGDDADSAGDLNPLGGARPGPPRGSAGGAADGMRLTLRVRAHIMMCMQQDQWQIVIAERGWVYVGKVARDGDEIRISECQNIRRWGTARGLGELAQQGPRAETLLDPYGVVRIHVLAVCGRVECNEAAWEAWLAKQAEPKARKQ